MFNEKAFLREFRQFRACSAKKSFRSEAGALTHARKVLEKKGLPHIKMRAYQCPQCQGWHTSKDRTPQEK